MQLHMILGPHAVGKSTRVGLFVDWLQTQEEPQNYPMLFGKEVGGWLFPKINMVVLGGLAVFQGKTRWKGADETVTLAGSTEAFLEYVKSILVAGHHVLLEGCPMFTSSLMFPENLHERLGPVHSLHYQYILYSSNREEDYIARVNQRNGRGPKEGGTSWGRQAQFLRVKEEVGTMLRTGDSMATYDSGAPLTMAGNGVLFGLWKHHDPNVEMNDVHKFTAFVMNGKGPQVEEQNVVKAKRGLLDDE